LTFNCGFAGVRHYELRMLYVVMSLDSSVSVVTEYRMNNQGYISTTTTTLPRPDTEGSFTGDKAAGT
jgi:hypothetical protein